jgi:putative DNA primase/helicase
VIIRAQLPANSRNRKGNIEVYDSKHFFVVTGNRLEGAPASIESRQAKLDELCARELGEKPVAVEHEDDHINHRGGLQPEDEEVIKRALAAKNGAKFCRLWEGDRRLWEGDDRVYPSQSEADCALYVMLAFYVGNEPERIDRLFRWSGLYRKKWERPDYRASTIRRALTPFEDEKPDPPGVATYRPKSAGESRRQPDIGNAHHTDLGTAGLFVRWYGHKLKFCHPWRRWFVWDGCRWAVGEHGEPHRLAMLTVTRLYAEASLGRKEDERTGIAKWAMSYERHERIEAVLKVARNIESIVVRPEQLDTDDNALTCRNGTLDLRTGILRPHDPTDLITRLAPVNFNPEAKAPRFEEFLERIFAGDTELIGFVQRAAGYSLTGETSEQCFTICYGVGANGKSTLMSILQELMGEYAATTPTETLLVKRHGDGIPNDLARLVGVRLVSATETEDGRRLAEAKLKALTGGDKIAARFMRAEWFEFTPKFKIWLATNHRPDIRGTDLGIWRRVHLVPFNVTIEKEDQDPHLLDALRAELPGILAWAVRGCLEWRKRGLDPPEAVKIATEEYRGDSDQLGTWIDDDCEVGDELSEWASDLYFDYKEWSQRSGEKTMTQKALGRQLSERGFKKKRMKQGIAYLGITLRHRIEV